MSILEVTGTDTKKYYILRARGCGKTIFRLEEIIKLYTADPPTIPLCKELEWMRNACAKFEIEVKKGDEDE